MKVVILAGGFGTRISEESDSKPKPMIEIGGKPILWHIMKTYSHHGINEFIVCCGYKQYVIKEYFANYFLHNSDVTFEIAKNSMKVHQTQSEDWTISVVDTGEKTLTGGRLKRVRDFIGDDDFCFTYGDGLSDLNVRKLIQYHRNHGKLGTVTAIQPPGRFGALTLSDTTVTSFQEKPKGEGSWVSGGFFVLNPKVIDLIAGDNITWEKEPLEQLASRGELQSYCHDGFWYAMDTLRDKNFLEDLWSSGKAPWKVWL